MKLLHHVVWLILIAILQPALINALSVFGVNGNVFLLFIVLIGFFAEECRGCSAEYYLGWFMIYMLGDL